MQYSYLLLLYFLCCCSIQDRKNPKTNDHLLEYEPVIYPIGNGITLKEVKIDTTLDHEQCKGLSISFVTEASAETFNTIKEKGHSGFYINIAVYKDSTMLFSRKDAEKDLYGKHILFNKGSFFSNPGEHYVEAVIPFHRLKLPVGKNNSKVHVQIFPVKYAADSSTRDYRKLEYIGNSVIAEKVFDFEFLAPPLKEKKLTVKGFEIVKSDEKKGKFDFGVLGRGLPDPYWQLRCGEDILFTSKPVKNTLKYAAVTSTNAFHITDKDILTLIVYDFDQGPFNNKDIIGSWSGTIQELNDTNNLEFGRIKDFKYTVDNLESEKKQTKKAR